MSWEDKRKLIKIVLAGINESGERNGVFIHRKDDKWHYEIRGAISDNIEGIAPMAKHRVMDLLQIEPEDFSNQMNLLSKYKAKLVNYIPFRIKSFISYRINVINHIFPNWDHEDKKLNSHREKSKYITLSEARLIQERITGRKYGITAVTKQVINNNLGIKSGVKMSQWLVDKEAFEKLVNGR
jgi:hypothetical protein